MRVTIARPIATVGSAGQEIYEQIEFGSIRKCPEIPVSGEKRDPAIYATLGDQ